MQHKILIIASRSDIAGGENYLLSVLRHIDRSRYRPVVWVPGQGTFATALEKMGIEFLIEEVNHNWLKPPLPWYTFLSGLRPRVQRLVKYIQEHQIELVHTNSNKILEGALAARLAGVHHLYAAHIDFQPNLPIFERVPLQQASFAQLMADLSSGILAVSAHVRDSLCPPISRERVVVVNNGLEMERYDAAVAAPKGRIRESLNLTSEHIVVVAAGRVTADKGFDLLISAAAKISIKYPHAVFLVCGPAESPTYLTELNQRLALQGMQSSFRFLGARHDLPELMAECDLFVLSSRREGHPYVLLEAMACGLPAVATLCGGVAETVEVGETGFTVPIGDVDALECALTRVIADKQLRNAMGRNAAERVRSKFDARSTAQGLFAEYERIFALPALTAGAYGVDLMLQAATEISELGTRLTLLEARSKKAERLAGIIFENPVVKWWRRWRATADT